MRSITVSVLFSLFILSCGNKKKECKGNTFVRLNETDSVCLNLYTDVDTNQIKEISTKAQDKVLLIFSGYTMPQKDILSTKNLSNSGIRELLQGITIVKLNVDNNLKRHDSDSTTIGNMSYNFQARRFNSNTQPYHVFINKDLSVAGMPSTYAPDEKDVLGFLKQSK
jgi:hypothetical protein